MKKNIYRSAHRPCCTVLLLTLMLLCTLHALAQDPPQYGTPFTGVPDRMDANIYQMNLREYSATRNIAGARTKLQRLKDLGINVVYLMPVYPLGVTNNPDGSPYAHRDLKGVASDLGTLTDLRGLVDDCHTLGMAVILDFVVNQTAWDHPWITQHPEYYLKNGSGNMYSPCPSPGYCFNDVAAIDLNHAGAAAAMVDAMRYWVFAANVDGFRLDWADQSPPAFWTNTIANLRGITTHNLLLLAEGSNEGTNSGCTTCGPNQPGFHYTQGFDYIFGTNFYWNVMKKVWNAGEPATNLDGVSTGEYTGAATTQLVARFLSNHDDYNADGSPFSFMSGGRNAVLSAFVVATYHRSVPFIYNGIEVGNTAPLTYPWRTGNINWTQDLTVYTEMQKILNLRNTSVALRRALPTSYTTSSNPNVIAFTKESGGEKVAVLVNVRNATQNFTIPAGMAGSYQDPFNNNAAVTLTAGATLSLSPYQYRVVKTGSCCTSSTLTVSPASVSLAASANTSTITVNSNVSWTVTDDQSWISTSVTAGANNGSFTISVTANTGAARTGTVTVTGGGITRTISVSQGGASVAVSIPGTVQAENWTAVSGVQTETTTDTGGGLNAGWIDAGDWLDYSVSVASAGTYTVSFRMASGGSGGTVELRNNANTTLCSASVGGTGGWQNWTTITTTAALAAGTQTLRLYATTAGYNINWVQFTQGGGVTYYALQNRWTGVYLNDNGASAGYGASITGDNYKWQKVPVDGTYFQLKNAATGEYMHIENQTGSVQCTAITPDWYSAQWSQDYIDGTWVRFRNRWKTGSMIHIENQTGAAQYAGAQDGWYSAQWQLVPLSGGSAGARMMSIAPGIQPRVEEPVQTEVLVYPNPSSDHEFNLVIPALAPGESASMSLTHVQGSQIMVSETVQKSGIIKHNLPQGVYILQIRGKNFTAIRRLVVE